MSLVLDVYFHHVCKDANQRADVLTKEVIDSDDVVVNVM